MADEGRKGSMPSCWDASTALRHSQPAASCSRAEVQKLVIADHRLVIMLSVTAGASETAGEFTLAWPGRDAV